MNHTDPPDERAGANLAIGDRVRISAGPLAGLMGVVATLTESGRLGLVIDGLADGVMVVVGASALEKCS